MFFPSFSFWDSWPSHFEQTTASRTAKEDGLEHARYKGNEIMLDEVR
jgi:hypothetical protein